MFINNIFYHFLLELLFFLVQNIAVVPKNIIKL